MTIQNAIKTKNIIIINPEETLSSALSKLHSSHDAGFVFSQDKHYLGVVNPYHCLIRNSFPGNAKVGHCLFHAPRLKVNFPITKIAQLMIESKVHYLPVFDKKENFIGIFSARHLLADLKDSPIFKIKIKEVLTEKKQPMITIYDNDLIANALNLFKKYKISKLIVIGKDMKLRGILTYFDLISFLIAPKSKEALGERAGNKVNLNYQQIKNFAKSYVLTLTENDYLNQALELILDKKIGSVVIVDNKKYPIGIITTRDFLRLLSKKNNEKKIEITEKNLSKENRQILGGFFEYLSNWVKKIPDVTKAKLFVKEEKKGGLFEVVLSLIYRKGQPTIIKKEGKNLRKVLKKIKGS
ncbi:MAG: CBS domain-containing protein [Microgenomates group bacterium]|nr:CBS domain-containing protein [Microgenomates group bacterium]